MSLIRRARGTVLRIVRRRGLSILVGLALVVPSAIVEFSNGGYPWWAQGLALIGSATGAAFLYAGVAGLGPDWIDDEG